MGWERTPIIPRWWIFETFKYYCGSGTPTYWWNEILYWTRSSILLSIARVDQKSCDRRSLIVTRHDVVVDHLLCNFITQQWPWLLYEKRSGDPLTHREYFVWLSSVCLFKIHSFTCYKNGWKIYWQYTVTIVSRCSVNSFYMVSVSKNLVQFF